MGSCRSCGVRAAIAGVLLILVAGCAGGAPPRAPVATAHSTQTEEPAADRSEPPPTATPVPIPSPTPDVAAAFVAKVRDGFVGSGTISGTMTMAGTRYPISGSFSMGRPDSALTISISVSGVAVTIETRSVNGKSFERSGDGPWLSRPSTPGFARLLAGSDAVRDAGLESVAGRRLHRLDLTSSAMLDASTLGVRADAGSFRARVHFWADDEGTPLGVGYDMSWRQTAGGKTVPTSMEVELMLTSNAVPAIEAPPDVWTEYDGGRGFRIAYPSEWSPKLDEATTGHYMWQGPDGYQWADVYVVTLPPSSGLDKLVAQGRRDARGLGVKTIDRDLAWTAVQGRKAWLLEFHYAYEDVEWHSLAVFTERNGIGYVVIVGDRSGFEDDDLATFRALLSSFEFK